MEISLHNKSVVPLPQIANGRGATVANKTVESSKLENKQSTPLPAQLGAVGAVTEAKIGALKSGKSEPHIFDRTLKPYDTVMLPHSAADEKRLQLMA